MAIGRTTEEIAKSAIGEARRYGIDPTDVFSMMSELLSIGDNVDVHVGYDRTTIFNQVLVDPSIKVHPTGGQRESATTRFDLVPLELIERLADVYNEGAVRYGKDNWKKGLQYSDVYNHMMIHLRQWISGNHDADHLAKVAWGALTLAYYEERKYATELDDLTGITHVQK